VSKLSELRIMTVLKLMVQEYNPHCKTWLEEIQLKEEREFLLNEFRKFSEEEAWWSDEEWDWFINRCLDFLGVPR
jgi:hypothetical protein